MLIGGGGPPPFDPSTLSPTSWLKASYPGSLPWNHNSLYKEVLNPSITTPPGNGAVLLGKTSARFDNLTSDMGTKTQTLAGADVLADSLITLTNYTVMGLVYVFHGATSPAAIYANGNLLGQDARFGVVVTSTGISVFHYDGAGFPEVDAVAALNNWHFFCVRYGGSIGLHKAQIDIDSTAGTPAALNPINILSQVATLGRTAYTVSGATNGFKFDIMERMTLQRDITDTERNNYKGYLNTTYGLSL